MQTIFEDSDEEIDVVTVEDEESDRRLVNFDSDAEDAFIDTVNTSKAFLLKKTDNDDRVSSVQGVYTSFNIADILREETSTKIPLKGKRNNLDTDDNTGKVYSKQNKNQSPNLLHVTKLNHPTSESNQAAATLQSPTNSLKSKQGDRTFLLFLCPKCNAEKIFDSADEQKNDLECINCEMKMCKGKLKINQDKLKCILLTCINCNLKTEATKVYLDSVKCPKCNSNFALSCRNCSKQLTGLLQAFYHVNNNCKFDLYKCHHCDHNYIDIDDLESHIRENHTSVICPICRGIYRDRNSMLKHKWHCKKPINLHCCFCRFSTKYTHCIKGHLQRLHAQWVETSAELQAVYKKIEENRSSGLHPTQPSQNEKMIARY